MVIFTWGAWFSCSNTYSFDRSMTDLVNDSTAAQSPKRKFSFRFPHLAHHSSGDKDSAVSTNSHHKGHALKTRNFSEEAKNVPDLQVN